MRPLTPRPTLLSLLMALSATAALAQTPTSIGLVASTPCGKNPIATVNLSAPAPAGGLPVQLSSSIPATVTVPTSVTVVQGASSQTFQVTCVQTSQSLAVNITASANGGSATALLNVLAPVLSGLNVKIDSPAAATGSAVLLGPAPPGGVIVTLSSSSGSAQVPQSVTVPGAAASATFPITLHPVSQATTVTIFGTGLGVTKSRDITLNPAGPESLLFPTGTGLFESSKTVVGGDRATVQVKLSAPAGASGVDVRITTSNISAASVLGNVTVPPGQIAANVVVTTVPLAQIVPLTISATVGDVTKTATLMIMPPSLDLIGVSTGTAIGGQDIQANVFPNNPPGASGMTVQLSSSNTNVALVPPSVTIPAGADRATFTVATFPLESNVTVTLTASGGGVTRTTQLKVVPEGPSSLKVTPDHVQGGTSSTGRLDAVLSNDTFTVQLSTDKPDVATVPASVTFGPGETSKTFLITTKPVLASQFVIVSGKVTQAMKSGPFGSVTSTRTGSVVVVTRTDGLTVDPPKVTGLTLSATSIGENKTLTGQVTLSGPPATSFPISIESSNPGAAHAVSLVSFPTGSSTGTFTVQSFQVPVDTTVTITATAGGAVRAASFTVKRD